MTASSTSREAYYKVTAQGKTIPQRERIMAYLEWVKHPVSRADIAHAFSHPRGHGLNMAGPVIPLASVCGRVNSLIEDGLLESAGTTLDQMTGHRVELVRPTGKKLRQMELDL